MKKLPIRALVFSLLTIIYCLPVYADDGLNIQRRINLQTTAQKVDTTEGTAYNDIYVAHNVIHVYDSKPTKSHQAHLIAVLESGTPFKRYLSEDGWEYILYRDGAGAGAYGWASSSNISSNARKQTAQVSSSSINTAVTKPMNYSYTIVQPLLVRSSNPSNGRSFSRPLATLPTGTQIYYQKSEDDWTQIKWYSTANKQYRYGWIASVKADFIFNEMTRESLDKNFSKYMVNIANLNNLVEQLINYIQKSNYSSGFNTANRLISSIFIVTDVPDSAQLKNMLSFAYLARAQYFLTREKDTAMAMKCIDEAISYDNNTVPFLYYAKGLIYEEQGFYSKARNCYLKEKARKVTRQNEGLMITLNKRINYVNRLIELAK